MKKALSRMLLLMAGITLVIGCSRDTSADAPEVSEKFTPGKKVGKWEFTEASASANSGASPQAGSAKAETQ